MKLGTLIAELEKHDPNVICTFDIGGGVISADTYRGYYADLALDNTAEYPVTVKDTLDVLYSVRGKTLCGYKGGEYTMHDRVDVYVAEWGVSTDVITSKVVTLDGKVVIVTHQEEY